MPRSIALLILQLDVSLAEFEEEGSCDARKDVIADGVETAGGGSEEVEAEPVENVFTSGPVRDAPAEAAMAAAEVTVVAAEAEADGRGYTAVVGMF